MESGQDAPETDLVTLEVDTDGRATVTLNSAATRNALSELLLDALVGRLRECEERDDVRVIVLAAAGPTFCAGADLKSAGGRMDGIVGGVVAVQRQIISGAKPVIARVRGAVRAGGLGLVAACDIAIATGDSTYALTETRLGLAPAVVSLSILPRVTARAASDIMLTGRRFEADEALQIGLVTCVADDGEIDREIDAVVANLLLAKDQGLRATKALVNRSVLATFDEQAPKMIELSAALFDTPVARDSTAAFR